MTSRNTRPIGIAAASFLVVALASTQIPLLNYLGFEYSVLIALVGSLICGLLHLSFWRRLERGSSFSVFILQSLGRSIVLLSIPIGVSAANALFVQNCSLAQGLVFFLLLAPPAAFFSIALATLIGSLAQGWRKTWFVVIVMLMLVQVFYVTVTRPQIFAFNYILGFFPGVTYDETLGVGGRLLIFRVETLLAALLMLGIARLVDARKRRPLFGALGTDPSMHRALPRWWTLGIAALALAWGILVFSSESLGLSSSAESIERSLGGRIEGDNVIVVYPKAILSANDAQRLLDLHEFLFAEAARGLRVAPRRKVTSFIYGSSREKGLLVGAAGTNIAKPWLRQLHINLGDVEAVLKHELVHVLAGEFGFALFRVGRNPGLIEGLAVALEKEAYGEPLHRLARSIELLGISTPLDDLFSVTGFVRTPGTVSYTVAGSFVRYLIDRYGMRRFKRLYRNGSFEETYRKPLDRLQAEWRARLRSIHPSEAEIEKAAYLFTRPSIFGKVCVRVIAALNEQTRELLARGSADSALALSDRSLALTEAPEAIFLHASALLKLGRSEELVTFAERRLADSTLSARLLPLRMTLGMAQWALGWKEQARHNFEILKATRISFAWAEGAALRMHVMDAMNSSALLPYLSGEVPESASVAFLRTLGKRGIPEETRSFLLGLAYDRQGIRDSALMEYSRARFDDPVLEFSRIRRMATAEFAKGQYQRAKMHFWEALNHVWSGASEIDLEVWIRRCDWMSEKAKSDPFTRTGSESTKRKPKLIFAQNFRLLGSRYSPTEINRGVFLWQ